MRVPSDASSCLLCGRLCHARFLPIPIYTVSEWVYRLEKKRSRWTPRVQIPHKLRTF